MQCRHHLDKQQRVLLAIEPAHAQHASCRRSGSSERLRLVDHVGGANEGDSQLEQPPCVRVALGQIGADDGHGQPARERAERDLEDVRGAVHPGRVRMSRSHVPGQILAHSQHDPASAHERKQSEADRVDVGPEEPDGVNAVEHAPKPACGPRERTQHLERMRQARVVRKTDELNLGSERVVRAARLRVETAGNDKPVHMRTQAGHEAHKRAFARDAGRV